MQTDDRKKSVMTIQKGVAVDAKDDYSVRVRKLSK